LAASELPVEDFHAATHHPGPASHLFVLCPGQDSKRVRCADGAESETMFFLKLVDGQIEFVKNEKGEVTNMVLHQNGQDVKGVKK
jgi:hypothetical protein